MIEFKEINLSYDGKKVINDLSLKIKQGEKVVIAGTSGTGKSSLIAMLLGFALPNSGELFFNNTLIDEKSTWSIRKEISYIDQDVNLGSGKLIDLLESISKLQANEHLDFSEQKIKDSLQHFELHSDIINKNIEELSGGERQRLAIIIAIMLERKVFLLDEITSALDKHLKQKVADYFMERAEYTCLIISHDHVWLNNPSAKVFNLEESRWEQ